MLELIHSGVNNIICTQPFGCLPNHIVGKGVIRNCAGITLSNIIAVDYDPGASEVNQLNRIKLMLATAQKNLKTESRRTGKRKALCLQALPGNHVAYIKGVKPRCIPQYTE